MGDMGTLAEELSGEWSNLGKTRASLSSSSDVPTKLEYQGIVDELQNEVLRLQGECKSLKRQLSAVCPAKADPDMAIVATEVEDTDVGRTDACPVTPATSSTIAQEAEQQPRQRVSLCARRRSLASNPQLVGVEDY